MEPAEHDRRAAPARGGGRDGDAFATSLGWGDANTPRAITILTKAVEALAAVNAQAVAARAEDCQATVFQIRPLLTDPRFRKLVVDRLDTEAARWWMTSFTDFPKDALPTVLNPLDRLAASPVICAFLGSPTDSYDIRHAMDRSKVVWICPAGTGPTDRLLVSLLVRDMLRAGLSRRDIPERDRRWFRLYLDELISLDGAPSTSLAEITEQLRKFGVRMHGMTQLLHRLSSDVRTALLQNASCLSTTAGSVERSGTSPTSGAARSRKPPNSTATTTGPASPWPASGSAPCRSAARSSARSLATWPARARCALCSWPRTPTPGRDHWPSSPPSPPPTRPTDDTIPEGQFA
ncbi:type IV secretory system conjugative DNA transfer family protein [Actinacidiphila soli]|uniref:hypothetical protein n=1 Tax=Actinacidiphila soli TaxID=2487275 RepID=UPI000FCB9C7A|nr:hypothetical protein [Actinacidiphila soli]